MFYILEEVFRDNFGEYVKIERLEEIWLGKVGEMVIVYVFFEIILLSVKLLKVKIFR